MKTEKDFVWQVQECMEVDSMEAFQCEQVALKHHHPCDALVVMRWILGIHNEQHTAENKIYMYLQHNEQELFQEECTIAFNKNTETYHVLTYAEIQTEPS